LVVEDDSGKVHRIMSRIVIGADGLRSSVAHLVDAPVYRAGRHATATMYGYWSGVDVSGYEWYFVPGAAAGAIPTSGGDTCVFVSVPASEFSRRFVPHAGRGFRALLEMTAPQVAAQIPHIGESHLRGFPGHPGFFRRAHGSGWALVGDAGYFKDPLTAHGITDALRDAELLAAAVGEGSDEALANYQQKRDAASLDLFETTDAIASFAWDLDSVRVLHESLAKAMSREVKLLANV
ncbi:MAG TPA: FAD-dependent monooxygenase, partial [Vicinamibacterales bacterium]